MAIRRVAVVFDDRARPETTGGYCVRALGGLADATHILPDAADRTADAAFDLFLRVDDGLDYPLPDWFRPLAWWAIDTHLDPERCLAQAAAADLTFAAQRPGAEALRAAGVAAEWLPLACDPDVHRPHEVPKRFDFTFVGHLFPGPRADLLAALRRRYPAHFVGRAYFEDMAELYSAARTVFNRSVRDDVNMRVFEALACGSLLLTNDLPAAGQPDLFQDGTHLATYEDEGELLDKMAFYLARPAARARVEAAGRAAVTASHTYRHRMARVLAAADGRPRAVRVGGEASAAGYDPGYFEFDRPELLAEIPAWARDVLDVGCGAGRLGEALKRRQPARVVGLERDPAAAAAARARLDEVVCGDAEELDPFPAAAFDAVVCGDVLEHLREPLAFLRRVRGWLRPAGRLVASLPNVRHHTVIRALLAGNWTYEPAGLLDQTHLRFFTRREVEKLFVRAGFSMPALAALPGPGHAEWAAAGRPGRVEVGGLRIGPLEPAEAEEFFAYQWLATAGPAPVPDWGLTSIVIPVCNELGYTRQCIDSLRLVTDEPYELVVVDNGSTDGTADYLRALAAADPRVRAITNPTNAGFPAAVNQGIRAAAGTQVLLLNNDTVLPTGWLRRLLAALHADPAVGLVGPCSNRVSGEQCVPVTYDGLAELDGFAWDWGRSRAGATEDTDRLVGFCLLVRRAVLDRVGLLDERFGLGCFEDDDLCLRARRAGYRAVIARDAFVHHFGSRTFRGLGLDLAGLLAENEGRFREKWEGAAPPAVGLPAADGPLPEVAVSACFIVRDNERTIRPCLESIRPWVDELVVVDTGSADETPAVAAELGARVFRFPWCDDFSAARNESLRHARGRWLFWMDSDDTIDEANGRALRALAAGPHDPAVHGYVVRVHCPGPGGPGEADLTVVDHVKLIRNRPDLRFEGRIHEQILPAIRRAGGEVAWTDLFVTHTGYDHSPAGQARKLERDFRLLRKELGERPDHPFTLFNLGMTHADVGEFAEAAAHLRASLAHSQPGESHVRKAYSLLAFALMRAGRLAEADEALREALREFPLDDELRFRRGVLLHQFGRLEEAVGVYEDLLARREDRHFTSVDPGLNGFKARHNLALVLCDLGRTADAALLWEEVLSEVPAYRPGWRGLGDALAAAGQAADLRDLAGRLERAGVHPSLGPVFEAAAERLDGRSRAALAILARARYRWPADLEVLQDLARLTFETDGPGAAAAPLADLTALVPDDGAAWHNLAVAQAANGDAVAAARSARESLRRRPESEATERLLAMFEGSLGGRPPVFADRPAGGPTIPGPVRRP